MTDVGTHGKVDRVAVETLGGGGSTYPCAVLPTCVFGDVALSSDGTSWIPQPHLLGESFDIALVDGKRLLGTSKSPRSPGGCILEARFFRSLEGLLFDEETLTLVATPRTAPLQHDSPKGRCLLGAPGERGISRRQKLEVVEISAWQAQGTLGLVQIDPSRMRESCTTFAACASAARDEDLDFRRPRHKPVPTMERPFPASQCAPRAFGSEPLQAREG